MILMIILTVKRNKSGNWYGLYTTKKALLQM